MSFQFCCTECQASYGESEVSLVCPACAVAQEPGGVTRGVLEVVLDELPRIWPDQQAGSREFLSAFLPLGPRAALPPLAVGATPLLSVPRLREELGLPDLWLKDDTRNPSGSTKDRASLLVVAKALEYGHHTIAAASTGNAATALAAVAATVGIRAVVLVPASAPPAKLVQMQSYGAQVVLVDGSYDDAFELCCQGCSELGWYNRNTALNPFTIEGKKTVALEIAAQLAPQLPDVVVVPTGDGVILAGVAKGFADLVCCGLVPRMPRLIAVQPTGSAAIVDALACGSETIVPVVEAASIADSLTVQAPRNALLCLRRIRDSGGAGVAVSDQAIITAIGDLARLTGVFAEPAAAAALAGLRAAREDGLVATDDRVVLLITGTGLKDIAAAASALRRPEPIQPDLDQLIAATAPLGKVLRRGSGPARR